MHDIENPMVIDSHWRHLEQPNRLMFDDCDERDEDLSDVDSDK